MYPWFNRVSFSLCEELTGDCKEAFEARIAKEQAKPEAASHWIVKCAEEIKSECDGTSDKSKAFECLQYAKLEGECALAIENRKLESLATNQILGVTNDPYDIQSAAESDAAAAVQANAAAAASAAQVAAAADAATVQAAGTQTVRAWMRCF